jgi:hypothetical protein
MKLRVTISLFVALAYATACPYLMAHPGVEVDPDYQHHRHLRVDARELQQGGGGGGFFDRFFGRFRGFFGRFRGGNNDNNNNNNNNNNGGGNGGSGGGGEPVPPVNDVVSAIQAARVQISNIIQDNQQMAAKFLRLTFHDCVGGCDGCVDLQNPLNFGLDLPINDLEPIVQQYIQFGLTRADIWVLGGLTASTVTQENTNVNFSMDWFGRPECK